jgi:Holliday junction resolvase-like predicted endonuclease
VSVERSLYISLLKLTKGSPALIEDVNKDARIPAVSCRALLQKMQNEGLIYLKPGYVEVDSESRLKIALKAASLGGDLQNISNHLCWREFEEIAASALKHNGYTVENNVRFTHNGRRWEIDVVGCRKPLVVCIDCKRWQHAIAPSALRKIVEDQAQRTKALADTLPNAKLRLECTHWGKAKFIPAVLSLMQGAYKFYYEVPVVPVFSLQDFICHLPLHIEKVKVYPKKFTTLASDLQNTGF